MRYIILCPDCGNGEISMVDNMIGFFECDKCKNLFDACNGNFGFTDLERNEVEIKEQSD